MLTLPGALGKYGPTQWGLEELPDALIQASNPKTTKSEHTMVLAVQARQ
jgi:hypothetical protein